MYISKIKDLYEDEFLRLVFFVKFKDYYGKFLVNRKKTEMKSKLEKGNHSI